MPSWSRVFQFGTFLSVGLCESRCLFTWGPSLNSCNSFFIFFIHSAFLLWHFCFLILLQKLFYFFYISFVDFSSCTLHQFIGKFSFVFFFFWKVLYCLFCLKLSKYLSTLLSFANIFCLFLSFVLLVLSAVFFFCIFIALYHFSFCLV